MLVQRTSKTAAALYFEVTFVLLQQLSDTRVHHVVPGVLCDESLLTLRCAALWCVGDGLRPNNVDEKL